MMAVFVRMKRVARIFAARIMRMIMPVRVRGAVPFRIFMHCHIPLR